MAISFSRTARSERNFTALLLPHLLMANDFAGARALFEELGLDSGQLSDFTDIEIVAELNPIRDVFPLVSDANETFTEDQGRVVPDLILRIGESVLVVEAKFFTHPPASDVAAQLSSQKKAIDKVLMGTKYESYRFYYAALTVRRLDDSEWPENFIRKTWCEIIRVLEPVFGADKSPDISYALENLKDAVDRSIQETNTSSPEKVRVKSIQELLEKARGFLENGNRYIGFKGGVQALNRVTVEEMETRGHYKISDSKPNKNWIPLHKVIAHYLKLKTD